MLAWAIEEEEKQEEEQEQEQEQQEQQEKNKKWGVQVVNANNKPKHRKLPKFLV